MQKENRNIYLKIFVNLIIYAVIIILIIFALPEVFMFFLPFIIGWVIASIANPLVKFLEKRVKMVRKHSSAIIIILVIGLVILAIYVMIRFILNQASIFISDVPNIVGLIDDRLDAVGESLSGVFEALPKDLKVSINQFYQNIREGFNTFISSKDVSEATIGIARSLIDYVLMILIIFISAYFFIKDREIIVKKVRSFVPEFFWEKYDIVIYYFKYAVGGYFKAQFKIMFILIIIMFIGFTILGTKYSILIAIITGLLDVLPVFGTGFILWPWALVEFILGNYFQAILIMIIYLVCQLVKNILQPKMVGDSIGLNPLLTLLLMYIGYRLAGIIGLIIAIPIGLMLVNLDRLGMFDNIKRGFRILIKEINEYRKF